MHFPLKVHDYEETTGILNLSSSSSLNDEKKIMEHYTQNVAKKGHVTDLHYFTIH